MAKVIKYGDCPWCVMDANKQAFLCDRCKQIHKLNMVDMSITEFCRLSEAFCILHKNCKEK